MSTLRSHLKSTDLARELTASDGFSIVVGSVIGSGIFLVPGAIALRLPSLKSVLIIWLVGGALSISGALSLAELASMFPAAGGLYIYLREAYGKMVAFLYGWGLVTMIHSGAIATLASGFSLYLSQIFRISPGSQKLVAAGIVLLTMGTNMMSVRHAKYFQNVGTIAKALGIVGLAVVLFTHGHNTALSTSMKMPLTAPWTAYGVSLIAVLWAYEGWHTVSFVAGEFRSPNRDLPRSLLFGTLAVAGLYLMLNIGYYSVLSSDQMRGLPSAAATAVQAAGLYKAEGVLSALILTSIVVSLNGMMLTGPRVYYAMAKDRAFFAGLAVTNSHTKVPVRALLIQGLWASVLAMTGTFQQLFTAVVFTGWIFYGLAVAGVIILRIKEPLRPRTFRTPGFPLLPLLFIAASLTVVISTCVAMPTRAIQGIALNLFGLPLYFIFRRRLQKEPDNLEHLEVAN